MVEGLIGAGYKTLICCPDGTKFDLMRNLDFIHDKYEIDRRGTNIISDTKLLCHYYFSNSLFIYTFYHKVNKKFLMYTGFGVYFVFILFTIIAGNRGDGVKAYKSVKLNDEEKGNPALFTLTEMGGSLQPLMQCIQIIPEQQNYRYGQSYMYATTTIIPNVGIWIVHPATKYSNLGAWLKEYLNLSYGPGFLIIA